jgi:hypothetical protein
MKNLPTDRDILKKIYNKYYDTFEDFERESKTRSSKIYVPIDIEEIANELHVDSELMFGRLYYHLNKKYGYTQPNGSKVYLLAPKVGNDKNAVNFPLLSAILAEMEETHKKNRLSIIFSIASLFISLLALLNTVF